MKTTIIVIAILLIVGVGIYYLVSNNNPSGTSVYTPAPTDNTGANAPGPTAPAASNTPPATLPSSATVSIKNFSFSPSALAVKAGTKVTWINNDGVSHTVTSDSGNLFNQTLSPGQSFSFTFANAGSVGYHCSIHPMMKGTVTVN